MSQRIDSLAIAAPAYNEAGGIEAVVAGWIAYLEENYRGRYEIVVCDDGSRDGTGNILAELARRFPAVRPQRHAVNQGAAAALTTAIRNTTKSWVLLLDSDGQFPIANLGRFEDAMARAPALAYIGFRPRKADSAFARLGSWASGRICNLFYGTRYRDFNCALKLVQGPLLRSLNLEAKGLNYSTEISARILECGVPMIEVEVEHQARVKGRSSRSLLRGSLHRFLFVAYLGKRRFLQSLGVLQKPASSP